MKDSEFLEILNLYLDHEIDATDSARLEAEVTSNPERRRIYRQYCRMDKACALLGDQEPATAPAWERGKSAAAARRRPGWSISVYGGGLAAAACIVTMVAVRLNHAAPGPAAALRAVAQETTVAEAQPVAPAPAAAYRRELQPVFTTHNLPSLVDSSGAPASPQLNDQFAWMNRVQLSPIQGMPLETAMFDPAPVLSEADNRAIGPVQSSQTQAERAAFQFQR